MTHKHRIVPGHMGGTYSEDNVIEVSPTQHAMWHWANYFLYQKEEDKLAAKGLSGCIGKEEIIREKLKLGGQKAAPKLNSHPNTKEARKKNLEKMLNHPNTADGMARGGAAASVISLPKMQKFVQENKDQFGKSPTRPKTSTGIWIEDDSGNRWEFPSIRTGSEYLRIPRRSLTKLVRGDILFYKQFKGGQIACS